MKLYHLSQTENNDYDTYDSCVVAAEDEAAARQTHPYYSAAEWKVSTTCTTWAPPEKVTVRYLGEAAEGTPAGVICASFNAG